MSSRRLQDVFKTSSRRFKKTSSGYLQDVFKIFSKRLAKASSRNLTKTSLRHLEDVFKTFWRRFQDIFNTSCKDVFKTFSRCIIKLNRLVNTSSRHIQLFSEVYCKDGYLQKDLSRSHSWEILWSLYKICKSDKNFSSFSFLLYYTF